MQMKKQYQILEDIQIANQLIKKVLNITGHQEISCETHSEVSARSRSMIRISRPKVNTILPFVKIERSNMKT